MNGFGVHEETLLLLAWIASQPQVREAVVQAARLSDPARRIAPEQVIRSLFDEPLAMLDRGTPESLVYRRLVEYRLGLCDFLCVDWALRGYGAVFFRENDSQTVKEDSTQETVLCWEIAQQQERLLTHLNHLSRDWHGDIQLGAQMLRLTFTNRIPLLVRTAACPFIIQEFLRISLERVNWHELAAWVLNVPFDRHQVSHDEVETALPALWLFAIREATWTLYGELGEAANDPSFPREARDCCLDLADQCYHASHAMREALSGG